MSVADAVNDKRMGSESLRKMDFNVFEEYLSILTLWSPLGHAQKLSACFSIQLQPFPNNFQRKYQESTKSVENATSRG